MSFYDASTGHLRLSWSRIRQWEECPEKGWHVGMGRKSPAADVTMFYKGNVVDQAMRQWLSLESPDPGWMQDRVDDIFDEHAEKIKNEQDGVIRWKPGQRDVAREECREAVTRLEPLLVTKVLPYDYQPAVRFEATIRVPTHTGELRSVILNGEMDLLVREKSYQPPRLHIWDLKMTRDAQYWRKTVAQTVFYDIACWCMFGVPSVEAGLLQPMVDGVPYISFTPSDEDRTQMFTRIARVANAVWDEVHPPKSDSAGCSTCEVRHACSKYAVRPGSNEVQLF